MLGAVFYVYVKSQQRHSTCTLSRHSVGVHRLNVTTKRKTVALKVMLRFSSGGLEVNRTPDTRIFNTRVRQKASIYAGYKGLTCNVAHTVLQ